LSEALWAYTPIHQTEFYAVFLMRYGYVPAAAYGRHYSSPPEVYRKRGHNNVARGHTLNGLALIETGHPDWKQCPECQFWYPETGYYWHANGYRPTGARRYQSVCKHCRCDGEKRRYRSRLGDYPN